MMNLKEEENLNFVELNAYVLVEDHKVIKNTIYLSKNEQRLTANSGIEIFPSSVSLLLIFSFYLLSFLNHFLILMCIEGVVSV